MIQIKDTSPTRENAWISSRTLSSREYGLMDRKEN